MKQSIINFVFYQLSELLTRGVHIVTVPLFVFIGMESEIVEISLIYYTASLISGGFLLGMPAYMLTKKNSGEFERALGAYASIFLLVFFVLGLISVILFFSLDNLFGMSAQNLFAGVLLGTILNMNLLTFNKFKIFDEGKNYFFFALIQFMATVGLGTALLYSFGSPILFYFSYLISLIFFIIRYSRYFKIKEIGKIRDALHYGMAFVPSAVSAWVIANLDKYLLKELISEIELSRYIQLYSLLSMLIITLLSIDKIFENQFFAMRFSNKSTKSIVSKFLLVSIFLTIGFLSIVLSVNHIYLDSRYDAYLILIIIGCGIPVAFNQVFSKFLLFEGKVYLLTRNSVLTALIVASGLFIFIGKYGLLFAGIATFSGYSLLAFSNYLSSIKFMKMKI